MKRSFKPLLYITCTIIFCLLFSINAMAQGDAGCDPLDPLCPIDGGVSLLIADGIGLGAKKAYAQHKKNS